MSTIEITLNGEITPIPSGLTLPDLPAHLGLPAAVLLIEHNGTALRRDEWAGRPLLPGDRLEILRVAAGG